MGLITAMVGGALQGGGEAGVKVGLNEQEALIQEARAQRLKEAAIELQKTGATLAQETHKANVETDIGAAGRMIEAKTPAMVEQQNALLPGEVEKRKQFAAVDTQEKVDEFTKLEPIRRKAAIDTAVQQLEALSTPEMLKSARNIALAKHIVDPTYTLIPNSDGTVTTFDTHSGKSTGQVKDPEGNSIIRKDPEELKAATSVINMANTNLRIAEAAYKAAQSDIDLNPSAKAAAVAEWKAAQEESRRTSAPAYAILYAKAGIKEPVEKAATSFPAPGGVNIQKLKDNPAQAADFDKVFGPGAAQKVLGGSKSVAAATQPPSSKPIIDTSPKPESGATPAKTERKPSESTADYEKAMENSFLTKVANRVGAGTVDFATAVGKLGWDWDHYHKTGELKRKYSTQGMTPVGDSFND